jgi:hypothetical protein
MILLVIEFLQMLGFTKKGDTNCRWVLGFTKKGTRIARIVHEFLCCRGLHEFYLSMTDGFWFLDLKKKGTRIARIVHEFLCCRRLLEFYLQMGFGFYKKGDTNCTNYTRIFML